MSGYPTISPARCLELLEPPQGPVDAVLDTDTYNEIDDQFALVYALLSPEKIRLEAVYAAPFYNERSSGPADGMERSYEEILRVMTHLGFDPSGMVYRGSTSYLPAKGTPCESAAASDLIARARAPRSGPLYVMTIGAITNVASALLMAPDIADKIVIVWLGGQPEYWDTAREFNLAQDVPAAQVVFDCGVPLVHIPCSNVAEMLRTTLPEMQAHVRGQGAIGDYLYQIYEDFSSDHFGRSKVIWDISAPAWLLSGQWVSTVLMPSLVLTDEVTWGPVDAARHPIRVARHIDRDAVLTDLFVKLAQHAQG